MKNTIIKVEKVSKLYRLEETKGTDLKAALQSKISGLVSQKKARESKELWALKDVSFEVKQGDTLGIIGANGAGKSTLLKILSEITTPTKGRIEMQGKVASILEIGTGFVPEMTGRENIFLSGKIIGIPKSEIARQLDEIIDFSEVADFIDTPVKFYSSGMYVRLAFSVIAHVNADILLFDEILGVGDASFQQKSSAKVQELVRQGRTLIAASHNLNKIIKLCDRIMLLSNGEIKALGDSGTILNEYMSNTVHYFSKNPKDAIVSMPVVSWNENDAPGSSEVKILRVSVAAYGKKPGEKILTTDAVEVEVDFIKSNDESRMDIGVLISHFENLLIATSSVWTDTDYEVQIKGKYTVSVIIPGNILNATIYSIDLRFILDNHVQTFNASYILSFAVHHDQSHSAEDDRYYRKFPCPVKPDVTWTINKTIG